MRRFGGGVEKWIRAEAMEVKEMEVTKTESVKAREVRDDREAPYDPCDPMIAGLHVNIEGRAFNVRRVGGLTLSAGAINGLGRHDLRGRACLLDLLAWKEGAPEDATLYQGTHGVPEALRLMADFLEASMDDAAVEHLRHASRRRGLNQTYRKPPVVSA